MEGIAVASTTAYNTAHTHFYEITLAYYSQTPPVTAATIYGVCMGRPVVTEIVSCNLIGYPAGIGKRE